jgi:hypothetical protein
MNYYIMRNGQTYGPYSEDVVRKYVAEGSMLGTDVGRTDGMTNWVPLSQLLGKTPESKPDYAASATPPVPPAAKPYVPVQQAPVMAGMSSSTTKKQYLDSIRAHSAYPTYRGFIGVFALIGYIVAGIVALGAVIGGVVSMNKTPGVGLAVIVGGLIYAAILYLMARFFKEAALILADLADSTVDANAHVRTTQQ